MQNIVLFFCDITGTIIGKNKNSIIDYQLFNQLLSNIISENQAKNLIFSLVSSDDSIIVNHQKNILQNYLNQSIILGKQFFDNGYIMNDNIYIKKQSKIEQMLAYIKELNKDFNIIKLYYADDCEFFHILLNELLSTDNYYNNLLTSIIPKAHQGLVELNSLLENETINNNIYILKK